MTRANVEGIVGDDLFTRHLDLSLLRGRRAGLVRCPFHEDRRPSFSVDLDRALFNCFSCGRQGGRRHFAELVGEEVRGHRRTEHHDTADWRQIAVERLRREEKRSRPWRHFWFANDYVRRCNRAAQEGRQAATKLGPDNPRTWPLLEQATRVQREGLRIEAELDALLKEGRPA